MLVIAVIAILTVGGYFVFVKKSGTVAQNPTPTPTQTSTSLPARQSSNLLAAPLAGGRVNAEGYTYQIAYKQGPNGSSLNDHLVFVSPSGKKTTIPDSIWFQIDSGSAFSKTGKRGGQTLTSFVMPIHPQEKNIIFLSTDEFLNETYSSIANRIYSYNLQTSELKEIYHEIAESNSPRDSIFSNFARIFRTVGIDGSKIIVLYDHPDNSPGPCSGIWDGPKDSMGYLELADVRGGLKSYTVPSYKVEEERIGTDKCLHELL